MHAFRGLPLFFRDAKFVLYVNAFDDEHTIFSFLDFSANLAHQLTVGFDFARLQRAPEGSKQSTGY
jgi:hypothetical protein